MMKLKNSSKTGAAQSKKAVLILAGIALFFTALPLGAQGNPRDLILMVDTSVGMSPYYTEAGEYLTGPFLAENLVFGDTFHLISFAEKPRFEIARQVHNEGDIKTVIGRILLLYPVEPGADITAALGYAERQIKAIPGGRAKKLVIVSDKDAASQINAVSARFKSIGTDVLFLRFPLRAGMARGSGSAGGPAAADQSRSGRAAEADQNRGTGAAGASPVPENNRGAALDGTGAEWDESADSNDQDQGRGASNNGGESAGNGSVPPVAAPQGSADGTGNSAGDGSGAGGETERDRPPSTAAANFLAAIPFPLPLLALGLLALLAVILVIVLVARHLRSSPNRVMASASLDDTAARNAELLNSFASQQAAAKLTPPHRRYYHHRDDTSQFMTNPPMLNLFVEEQNTAIGRRNVHALKKGSTFTVGGGSSDFLIFLVPLPARLGQLRYDGNNCTFVPLKPKFFPDIGGKPVSECIGKTIRVLSDKNYEVFFRFEHYKDPLIMLNQLLHSINVPEAPPKAG
ncbi:MAG: hypothetical protein LBN92_07220 [Treponema sp.]|jgi:hypothetical protein|nr:hypothetical protein [Treponema sp.]